MITEVSSTYVQVTRKLDGKGRLNLPGDLREAAGFAPDEQVEVTLASIVDAPGKKKKAFIITRKEESHENTEQRKGSL